MIQGVHPALITPRRPDSHQADLSAALELVDFVSRSGVDGIVLLGSTGEFVHFDVEERLRLSQFAIKRSRVPVTVNISHSSWDGALTLARGACGQGAAAILVMPPYFFRHGQESIEEFCLWLAHELGNGIPILLCNMPAFTNEFELVTLTRLLATGRFAGVKDSSGEIDRFRHVQAFKQQTAFSLLIGGERVYAAARAEGADGVISGSACAVPELILGLDRAIRSGVADKRIRLEGSLAELAAHLSTLPFPAGIREAVALRGLKTGPPALPLGKELNAELGQFREWFRGWLPGTLKEACDA